MKFDPVVVFIKAGDTVQWTGLPTGSHDGVAIPGMIPEGAELFNKKEEGATVTLTEEGAYVYACRPHQSLGMLGAIVVGDKMPTNMDQIRKSPENKERSREPSKSSKASRGEVRQVRRMTVTGFSRGRLPSREGAVVSA